MCLNVFQFLAAIFIVANGRAQNVLSLCFFFQMSSKTRLGIWTKKMGCYIWDQSDNNVKKVHLIIEFDHKIKIPHSRKMKKTKIWKKRFSQQGIAVIALIVSRSPGILGLKNEVLGFERFSSKFQPLKCK